MPPIFGKFIKKYLNSLVIPVMSTDEGLRIHIGRVVVVKIDFLEVASTGKSSSARGNIYFVAIAIAKVILRFHKN